MEVVYSSAGIREALQIEDGQLLRKAILQIRNELSRTNDLSPFASILTTNGLDLFFDTWQRCFKEKSDALSALPASLTAQVLQSIERSVDKQPLGLVIIDRIIDSHMRNLQNNISSGKHELVLSSIKLLNVMVRYGSGSRCKKLMDNFNWEIKGLGKLLSMRRRNEPSSLFSKPDIRTLMILFITGFLQGSLYTKKMLFDKGHFLMPLIFRSLGEDHYQVVDYFLATLCRDVYADHTLSRSIALRAIDRKSLTTLLSLYHKSHEVRTIVHHFFLEICQPGSGIGFYANGLYDSETLNDEVENVGLERKMPNWRIFHVVENLRPTEDPLQRGLLLRILKSFPDLRYHFLKHCRLSTDPRLSSQWLVSMSLFITLAHLEIAKRFHGSNAGYHSQPPPTARIRELCIPSVLTPQNMSKALLSNSVLVRYTALVVLISCLQMTARMKFMLENGQNAMGERWREAWRELQMEVTGRLPDFNTLVNFNTALDGNGDMVEEAKLKCMALYLKIIPRASNQSFGSGRMLSKALDHHADSSQDTSPFANLIQSHSLDIVSNDQSFRVDGRVTSLPYGNIFALIATYLQTDDKHVKTSLDEIISRLAGQSMAFQGQHCNIEIWMRAFQTIPHSSLPLTFFDQCLERFHKSPYKYIDALETLLLQSRQSLETRLSTEPLPTGEGGLRQNAIQLQLGCYDEALASTSPLIPPLLMTCLEQLEIQRTKNIINDEAASTIVTIAARIIASVRALLPSDDLLQAMDQSCEVSRGKLHAQVLHSEQYYTTNLWSEMIHAVLELVQHNKGGLYSYLESFTTKEKLCAIAPDGHQIKVVCTIFIACLHDGETRTAELLSTIAAQSETHTPLLESLVASIPEYMQFSKLPSNVAISLCPVFTKFQIGQVLDVIQLDHKSPKNLPFLLSLSKRTRKLFAETGDEGIAVLALRLVACLLRKSMDESERIYGEVRRVLETLFDAGQTIHHSSFFRSWANAILEGQMKTVLKTTSRIEIMRDVLPCLLKVVFDREKKYLKKIQRFIADMDIDLADKLPLIDAAQVAYRDNKALERTLWQDDLLDQLVWTALTKKSKSVTWNNQLVKIINDESMSHRKLISRMGKAYDSLDSRFSLDRVNLRAFRLFFYKLLALVLQWLTRRFAEDVVLTEDTTALCAELTTEIIVNDSPIPPNVGEPVLIAAIQNHLANPVVIKVCRTMCSVMGRAPGMITRLLQKLFNHPMLKNLHAHSQRKNVISLLHAIYFLDSTAVSQSWIKTALVEQYEGTLGSADLMLKSCLIAYEKNASESAMPDICLWGTRGRSIRYALDTHPDAEDILANLDSSSMIKTINNYSIQAKILFHLRKPKFSKEVSFESTAYDDDDSPEHKTVYDAEFLISLLGALLIQSEKRSLRWPEIIDSHLLGIAILQFATASVQTRSQAMIVLQIAYADIERTTFPEQPQILLILDLLRDSIKMNEKNFRLLGPVAMFLAQGLHATVNSSSSMYPRYMKYLLQRPVLSLDDIPLFLSTLWSRESTARRDRIWQLRLLKNGLLADSDLSVYTQHKVFQTVLAIYRTPVCDMVQRKLIISLLAEAASHRSFADYLVNRLAIFAWIVSIFRDESDLAIALSLLRLTLCLKRNAFMLSYEKYNTSSSVCHLVSILEAALSRDDWEASSSSADYILLLVSILRSLVLNSQIVDRDAHRLVVLVSPFLVRLDGLATDRNQQSTDSEEMQSYVRWINSSKGPFHLSSEILFGHFASKDMMATMPVKMMETLLALPANAACHSTFQYLSKRLLSPGNTWLDLRLEEARMHVLKRDWKQLDALLAPLRVK